jgi:hypothetical protein
MFYVTGMDWDYSIERNREGLLGAIMGLFALIGLTEGGVVERLSRPVYRKVLGQLRSAEAAVRRLIVMARDIKVEPRPRRPMPKGLARSRKGRFQSTGQGHSKANGTRGASFPLCDPQKRSDAGRPRRRRRRYKGPEPRIRVLDYDPRIPPFLRGPDPTPAPVVEKRVAAKDKTVSARRLCRRLFALVRALGNMRREAERYARWLAQPVEDRRPRRERALRFGWPPGWRIRPTHEVHEILKECHWLVRSLPEPDTS